MTEATSATPSTSALLEVDGVAAFVVERRRYGTHTFTWVEFVTADGVRHFCHDPWPAVTPKRSEVEEQARSLAERAGAGDVGCRCANPSVPPA